MLALVFFAAATFRSVSYLFILPIVRYFHEPKGLRKYPGFSPLSGFTDLRHIYLSACGYRSKDLYEAHRRAPILRTGPNSLSFGGTHAIKDIYSHSTPCLKDLNYVVLGESHVRMRAIMLASIKRSSRRLPSGTSNAGNLRSPDDGPAPQGHRCPLHDAPTTCKLRSHEGDDITRQPVRRDRPETRPFLL
ncbi:uncharacterized protein BO95DRAFT_198556 [Aspergillus brunneoviolaceus CBS 621.78]|uniref:Uncharacterized protein n=1 Tax=Aspergillus brunneoviolaceus CBS 621.78 TaxID=1450534 RepID=A0ACD1GLZ1_9EURO|nr:hypothetical protein BO95DRAFT_198556 [Aspergillus brunneoviolaceus CBS 621.78]RAH50369.1 hypothetical protein BO95DRAFT_198556 [Aspergillus brunneoviolaceus CBS 621.78]